MVQEKCTIYFRKQIYSYLYLNEDLNNVWMLKYELNKQIYKISYDHDHCVPQSLANYLKVTSTVKRISTFQITIIHLFPNIVRVKRNINGVCRNYNVKNSCLRSEEKKCVIWKNEKWNDISSFIYLWINRNICKKKNKKGKREIAMILCTFVVREER